MNRKIMSLAGLLFLSGMALAMVLAYFASGAAVAGAQGSERREAGYAEGMRDTAVTHIPTQPVARSYPEGTGGLSGMQTSQTSEANSRVEATSGSLSSVYRFSGVADDGAQGQPDRKIATSVHCTNIGSAAAQVELQVYDFSGTTVYTASLTLSPGKTGTVSTQGTAVYFEDALFGGVPGTHTINQGSGQILSSTPAIICIAQALDPLNVPPTFVTSLEMYKQ